MVEKIRIQQEVTTHCNSNCGFCPRHVVGPRRSLGHITDEMAEVAISRYQEAQPLKVSISGMGEPLMWPGIYDFVDRVKELDVQLSMNSNAILLTKESERLIGALDELQINISLPTRELYKAYRGKDEFDTAMERLMAFYETKGDRKPDTEIRLLKFKNTEPYLKGFIRKYSPMLHEGDAIRVAYFQNWGGLIKESFFGVSYGEAPPGYAVVCSDLLSRYLTITKEGNAFACCFAIAFPEDHPFKLGNIRENSILELLDSPKRAELRKFQAHRKYVNECAFCSKAKLGPDGAKFAGIRYINKPVRDP